MAIGLVMIGLGAGAVAVQGAEQAEIGEFVANCPVSHHLSDDPIVRFGLPGMSHMHVFMGAVSTNATSTLTSLRLGATTCNPVSDRSAYWVPALYRADNTEIPIENATFYYLAQVNTPQNIQPFPPGLAMIAGNAMSTTIPASQSHFKWGCLGSGVSSTTAFVVCPAGSKLELLLNFPECWDGVNLDSSDHKRHMAYAAGGVCPASHPVIVPKLQFKLRYNGPGEAGMRLSSGPGASAHGDFINVWGSTAQANRVRCLRELIKCGPGGYPGLTDAPIALRRVALPAVTAAR
jgi:hypothetical protein